MDKARLEAVNQRLSAGQFGVSIEQHGHRLYLRATLPPKPRSRRATPYQQRIALGIRANPGNLALAEKEARKVGALLACGEFDWLPYLRGAVARPESVGDWVCKFEGEIRPGLADITWSKDYRQPFDRLPHDRPLTPELLITTLEQTKPNSKTRMRYFLAYQRLANFAGVPVDLKPYQGNYSASEVEPRNLPDDATIAATWAQMKNESWRWIFGMIATFGLRSHECFYLDCEELSDGGHMVRVTEGKTGGRLVWACYPEWVELFNLRDVKLPPVNGTQHSHFTQRVCHYFTDNIPMTALDLRHCWAIRTLLFGMPYEIAAKQMGHSVAVHERTYHRWITREHHQRVYDTLMLRSDRPIAPNLGTTRDK